MGSLDGWTWRRVCSFDPADEDETRMTTARQGFGIEELDRELGGGVLPGTLTVVAGATGIGKTQLGLRWADTGARAEGARGVICDLTSRGDSQNHLPYARMQLRLGDPPLPGEPLPSRSSDTWDWSQPLGGYLSSDRTSGSAGEPWGSGSRGLA